MRRKQLTMYKAVIVFLKREIDECENHNVQLSRKTKAIIYMLLISPFITQIIAILCNHSNLGYLVFMPDVVVLFYMVLHKRIKQRNQYV